MMYIVLYIFAGIVLTIYGPLADKIKHQKARLSKPSPADEWAGRKQAPAGKIRVFLMLVNLISVVLFPVMYAILVWDYFRGKKKDLPEPYMEKTRKPLYFRLMGGHGTFHCNTCGYDNKLTSFLHGHDDDDEPSLAAGFQCQSCGKFETYTEKTIHVEPKTCTCGGVFSRDEVLFCPVCKSKEVEFNTRFIF